MKHIVLCGMMGAGKSYLAREFSQIRKIPFFDIDNEIEKGENQSIQSIFKLESEKAFRRIEKKYLQKILLHKKRSIIALGAGAIIDDFNRKILSKQTIRIYVKTSMKTIVERLKDDEKRPLIKDKKQLEKTLANLLKKRELHYMEADFIFENLDTKKSLTRLNWIWDEHIRD